MFGAETMMLGAANVSSLDMDEFFIQDVWLGQSVSATTVVKAKFCPTSRKQHCTDWSVVGDGTSDNDATASGYHDTTGAELPTYLVAKSAVQALKVGDKKVVFRWEW
ncbi:hypothetical protein O9992_05340 [Vibrio lentus]|nr:hypothetical protein [Vibrio lentus]